MIEQRRAPRVEIEMPCTLHRRSGSPIEGRTVDLGPGGMRVCTKRPLAADETQRFELQGIDGRARVLRQQSAIRTRSASRSSPSRRAVSCPG